MPIYVVFNQKDGVIKIRYFEDPINITVWLDEEIKEKGPTTVSKITCDPAEAVRVAIMDPLKNLLKKTS